MRKTSGLKNRKLKKSKELVKYIRDDNDTVINPYIVAYTLKAPDVIKQTENDLPTNLINFALSPLLTKGENDEAKEELKVESSNSFRENIGDRKYQYNNPNFTAEICGALAKVKCRHCYSSGLQHFSIPEKVKWAEACWCVKNNLDKMEKEVEGSKRVLLGY